MLNVNIAPYWCDHFLNVFFYLNRQTNCLFSYFQDFQWAKDKICCMSGWKIDSEKYRKTEKLFTEIWVSTRSRKNISTIQYMMNDFCWKKLLFIVPILDYFFCRTRPLFCPMLHNETKIDVLAKNSTMLFVVFDGFFLKFWKVFLKQNL